MRLASSSVLLLLAFAACELPRPAHSFTPTDAAADMGGTAAGTRDEDAAVVIPVTPGGPGGMEGGPEAGAPRSDGGTAVGSADAGPPSPLQGLAGRYLMRMDLHSTASVRATSLTNIQTRNVISHLMVTEIGVSGSQLQGTERLCYQTFKHTCGPPCTSLSSEMKLGVLNFLVQMPGAMRTYALRGMTLTGERQTLPLGFDASKNSMLPASRAQGTGVWDSIPTVAGLEGVAVHLDVKSSLKNVSCDVYGAQRFVSQFSGKLASLDALEPDSAFTLDTTGSEAVALGGSNADCAGNQEGMSTAGKQTVRFAPVDSEEFSDQEFWGCPAREEWDSRPELAPPSP